GGGCGRDGATIATAFFGFCGDAAATAVETASNAPAASRSTRLKTAIRPAIPPREGRRPPYSGPTDHPFCRILGAKPAQLRAIANAIACRSPIDSRRYA